MNHTELEAAIHEALRRMLERAQGEDPPPDLDGKTKPIGDLGFDSMAGVGFLCELEDFGIKVADDLNPFVDDAKHRARSIDEMIIFIEAHTQPAGAAG
jgi:hypothetical protein